MSSKRLRFSDLRLVPSGYAADRGEMTRGSIEQIARAARLVLAPDVRADQPLPGVALFERLESYNVGGKEITFGVDDEMPRGVEAEARFEPSTGKILVLLAERTYHQLEAGDPEARLTLYHEIGHAVLHHDQLVRMSTIPHAQAALARAVKHTRREDTEWQADTFAELFACPRKTQHAYRGVPLELMAERLKLPGRVLARLMIDRRLLRRHIQLALNFEQTEGVSADLA